MTTRQTKTPAQRAQEAFDVADRLVVRLSEKTDRLKTAHDQAGNELAAARARRDYLAQNPDLPQRPEPVTTDA